jgi:hypothetical protein
LPRRAERVPLTRSILPHTNTPWQGALHRTDTFEMPPRDEMLRMFPLQAELVGRISRP